jgi:hypothetical protein
MRRQNLLYYKNATLLKNALSFFVQSVLQTSDTVKHFNVFCWCENDELYASIVSSIACAVKICILNCSTICVRTPCMQMISSLPCLRRAVMKIYFSYCTPFSIFLWHLLSRLLCVQIAYFPQTVKRIWCNCCSTNKYVIGLIKQF